MSINRTHQHIVTNFQEEQQRLESKKSVSLTALQTNIDKKIGTNKFTRFLNKIFHHRRTVALNNLQSTLKNSFGTEVDFNEIESLLKHLPKSTQNLFKAYLKLLEETEAPEVFKTKLTQEEFQALYDSKIEKPLGKGSFGTVYSSKEGKYVFKVPNQGNSMAEDKKNNEALKHNFDAFDKQLYYKEYQGFITKYVGTFKNKDGIEVAVFEKIEGQDFWDYHTPESSELVRFFAQFATAIAISHEAGCVNSDVKPSNAMVAPEAGLLKLIDQGGIIDLTQENPMFTCCTSAYASPEVLLRYYNRSEKMMTPASDVYSLGCSILEKLQDVAEPSIGKKIRRVLNKLHEDFCDFELYPNHYLQLRKGFASYIADFCKKFEVIEGDPEGSEFIGLLLKDCLAFNPQDRISAAQAGEILQVFSSYLEAKEENLTAEMMGKPLKDVKCPNYADVKKMAVQDCPKGIPIALRKMLFDTDLKTQQKAIANIEKLVESDPSYINTPSYGLVLAMKEPKHFQNWIMGNTESAKELKERIYVRGQDPKDKQDMPVPKEIYHRIFSTGILTNGLSSWDEFVPPKIPTMRNPSRPNPFDLFKERT